MNHFGEHIKQLREQRKLLQRQVAAALETDTAFVSKFEKGDKKATREQVFKLADFFNVDKDELLSLWLAEKVYDVLKDEDVAKEAMQIAEEKLKTK
jgi:transcriptional regulator with XRE-family HTH domain